jgi:hypothetical protein
MIINELTVEQFDKEVNKIIPALTFRVDKYSISISEQKLNNLFK